METTRFAPSPTGLLHLGHAYSALFAWEQGRGGAFLLRIEDIDATRCKEEFVEAILQDLAWLGLCWQLPVRRQSRHMDDYAGALARLSDLGVLYPCFCTRAEIAAEVRRAGAAPHGPEGPLYPGTCRSLPAAEAAQRRQAGHPFALRLWAERAAERTGPLSFRDRGHGEIAVDPGLLGDVVLARKEVPTSYHLSVTLDDHLQGVTLVTRGEDLLPATHVHRTLQALLCLRQPEYHHHPLLRDPSGERLAKRLGAPSLRSLREAGVSPDEVRRQAGY